jgi:phospholipid/cholesterol/gamma-HCH transport system permease protein
MRTDQHATGTGNLALERGPDGALVIHLQGDWRIHHGMPSVSRLRAEFAPSPPRRVMFESGSLGNWDTSLLNFVSGVSALCAVRGVAMDRSGLPPGLERLLGLAESVPEKKDARRDGRREPLVARVGRAAIALGNSARDSMTFLGQVTIALNSFVRRKARYRRSDLLEIIQACGAGALGIVTLISYLVGVILAFMGAVQLQQFGAQIYVADLVGIGMIREMGAVMTAVIMSGRTGAAFAAQLGTMKVTQEIDAYVTMGISPMEFLVLPRIVALVMMMPLLCLYADFMGVMGGGTVAAVRFGISPATYWRETVHAVHMNDLMGGLFKASVYGILIALAGCLRGFQCGNSSSAVGDAATEAVVLSIVLIVIACGIFAVLFNILQI